MTSLGAILSPKGRVLPVVSIVGVIILLWYALAVALNAPQVTERLNGSGAEWGPRDLIVGAWTMDRPVLPSPDQIAREFIGTTFEVAIDSKRSLVRHAGITASA